MGGGQGPAGYAAAYLCPISQTALQSFPYGAGGCLLYTSKIAAALLGDGKAKVKGLLSMKTGKTYDGTVLLADTGGKYVNYRIERRAKN